MELLALPAFTDNYIWMLIHEGQALVVDPGESFPVLQALEERGLSLTAILVTHHHGDHVAGLPDLQARLQGPVWGPASPALPVPVQALHGGETLHWCDRRIEVIAVPGHTASHLAFHLPAEDPEAPLLFCGDTLFSGGCGRLFEGTPAQMHDSLQRLAALPGATQVCCAHEYTAANLRFATAADPGNAALLAHVRQVQAWRDEGRPSLPSTLALERAINPFLRCDQAALAASARAHGAASEAPTEVFAALRAWKNEFR